MRSEAFTGNGSAEIPFTSELASSFAGIVEKPVVAQMPPQLKVFSGQSFLGTRACGDGTCALPPVFGSQTIGREYCFSTSQQSIDVEAMPTTRSDPGPGCFAQWMFADPVWYWDKVVRDYIEIPGQERWVFFDSGCNKWLEEMWNSTPEWAPLPVWTEEGVASVQWTYNFPVKKQTRQEWKETSPGVFERVSKTQRDIKRILIPTEGN